MQADYVACGRVLKRAGGIRIKPEAIDANLVFIEIGIGTQRGDGNHPQQQNQKLP